MDAGVTHSPLTMIVIRYEGLGVRTPLETLTAETNMGPRVAPLYTSVADPDQGPGSPKLRRSTDALSWYPTEPAAVDDRLSPCP
jgi:hypothetical protein